MDHQKFLLSLSLSLSLTIAALHQVTLAITSDELVEFTPLDPTANNETIFQISEQLCTSCTGHDPLLYVFEHNLVRAKKSLPPLSWDTAVAAYAAGYAAERKHDCELVHSHPPPENDVGENIFWASGTGWTPGDAVKAWADEEKLYNYEANTCQPGEMCGHYTQLVWSSTQKVGCASVVCDTGDTFITCNYSPPGNYEGERPY